MPNNRPLATLPRRAAAGTRSAPLGRPTSPESVRALLAQLLDSAGLDHDQRVEVLGGALVAEAVRPYWEAGHSPDDAHKLLRIRDGELADAVEALSPVLLGRAEARETAHDALRAIDEMLATPSRE